MGAGMDHVEDGHCWWWAQQGEAVPLAAAQAKREWSGMYGRLSTALSRVFRGRPDLWQVRQPHAASYQVLAMKAGTYRYQDVRWLITQRQETTSQTGQLVHM